MQLPRHSQSYCHLVQLISAENNQGCLIHNCTQAFRVGASQPSLTIISETITANYFCFCIGWQKFPPVLPGLELFSVPAQLHVLVWEVLSRRRVNSQMEHTDGRRCNARDPHDSKHSKWTRSIISTWVKKKSSIWPVADAEPRRDSGTSRPPESTWFKHRIRHKIEINGFGKKADKDIHPIWPSSWRSWIFDADLRWLARVARL